MVMRTLLPAGLTSLRLCPHGLNGRLKARITLAMLSISLTVLWLPKDQRCRLSLKTILEATGMASFLPSTVAGSNCQVFTAWRIDS